MAQKQLRGQRIFMATQAFHLAGGTIVQPGDTAVEGHPILKGRMSLFVPFVPRFGTYEPAPEVEPDPEPDPEPKPDPDPDA